LFHLAEGLIAFAVVGQEPQGAIFRKHHEVAIDREQRMRSGRSKRPSLQAGWRVNRGGKICIEKRWTNSSPGIESVFFWPPFL